ncbi:MAG TPA: hypothetical protein PLP29_06395 [Candidatus Ozemobacteraceae bacterium]|nr:hypothetical protein [Candidatus Ozemobacteraceae bacterium]
MSVRTIRTVCRVVLVVVALTAAGVSLAGPHVAPAPGMYVVNYGLLLALHPAMSNFDMVLGRHLRSDLPFQDQSAMARLTDQINALAAKARTETEQVQTEIDKLVLQKTDLENRIGQNVVEFNQERGTFTGEQTRQIQMQKLGELDRSVAALQARQNKIWDDVMNPLYLPREYSQKLLEQTLAQIDGLLGEVSRARGGAMILDSDFVRVQPRPVSIPVAHSTGADPLSIRLFQSLLQSDLVGRVPDVYLQNPELRQYGAAMKRQIEESFDRNVAAQISKSPLYDELIGARSRLFLAGSGSFDLTREVLAELYRRNQVKPDIAQRILNRIP